MTKFVMHEFQNNLRLIRWCAASSDMYAMAFTQWIVSQYVFVCICVCICVCIHVCICICCTLLFDIYMMAFTQWIIGQYGPASKPTLILICETNDICQLSEGKAKKVT